jgi:hypothetical protein
MCPQGFYCPSNASSPQACPIGTTYCDQQGQDAPTPCPSTYYCPDAIHKYPCPPGYSCEDKTTATFNDCPADKYCPGECELVFALSPLKKNTHTN